jgi:hypothetical protein
VDAFVAYCEQLPPDEANLLISALVKRFHPQALAILGEITHEDEKQCLQARDDVSMAYKSESWQPINRKLESVGYTSKSNRVRKYILDGISEILPNATFINRKQLIISNSWHDWQVDTEIDINRKGGINLQYIHYTYRSDVSTKHIGEGSDDSDRTLFDHIRNSPHGRTNMLQWLGLGQSWWIINFEEDEEIMARTLLQCCRYYIDHLPDFLSGLNIDD